VKKFTRVLSYVTAMVMMVGMTACGAGSNGATEGTTTVKETTLTETTTVIATTEETTVETTDSDLVSASKPVILVVSFGTSYNDSRDITIGAVEQAIADAYPDFEVRRAFTSQIIIDILKEREKLEIDNVEEAMEHLVEDGVKELIVQPTHVMSGYEYDDLAGTVKMYADKFEKISIGTPLLTSDEDFKWMIDVLTEETADFNKEGTAIVFMGHGTEHAANVTYQRLQDKMTEAGYNNYYVGTVEATPSLDDIVAAVKKGGYSKVVLEPLMVVAGDHANNDMAGDEEDSWKSILTKERFEVECLLRGLGQFEGVQRLYIKHVQAAMDAVGGIDAEEGMVNLEEAVDGSKLVDGTYPISVTSSSSMFKIVDAQLTVKEGHMSAVLTLSGTGYEKLFMGTKEDAQKAPEEEYHYFTEDGEGKYTYKIPVEALNLEIDCAAWSIKKSEWYDRVLVFESASLPKEAFK